MRSGTRCLRLPPPSAAAPAHTRPLSHQCTWPASLSLLNSALEQSLFPFSRSGSATEQGAGPNHCELTPSTSISSSLQAITHALRLSAPLCLWLDPTTIVFMGRTDGEATWLGSLGRCQCLEEQDCAGRASTVWGTKHETCPPPPRIPQTFYLGDVT